MEQQDQNAPKKMDMKTIAQIMYGCWAGGFVLSFTGLGILGLAAPIIAFIKKSEAAGTIYASHFDWVIRTFVIAVIAALISIPLMAVFIGVPLLVAVALWSLYRLIKGGLKLYENQPIDNPKAFI